MFRSRSRDFLHLLFHTRAFQDAKIITNRHSFRGQLLPITDADLCCPKKSSPVQSRSVGMLAKNLSLQMQILP